MEQHGPIRKRPVTLRLPDWSPLRLTAAALVLVGLTWLPAPPAALAAPASDEEMALYTRIAAVNVCIARAAGVDFDRAVGIAGETIAQLIGGRHGSTIAQVGSRPLGSEELRRGAINSAVLGAAELCADQVPAAVQQKVREALRQGGSGVPARQP